MRACRRPSRKPPTRCSVRARANSARPVCSFPALLTSSLKDPPMPTSPLPLNGFLVLDLTAHRAGPTAVRQLADWGADVIKIEPPGEQVDATGSRRDGPDFQNLHRNKRSMTLNLKTQGRAGDLFQARPARRRHRRELQIRRKAPARHRLRGGEKDQPAHCIWQHLRLRPGRTLCRPPRRRPDRAGHGRADVDHRPSGPRPRARRHRNQRHLGRALAVLRHRSRSARTASAPARANGCRPRCSKHRSTCSIFRRRAI